MRVVRATADTFRFRELASSWLAAEDRCIEPDEAAPFSYLVVFHVLLLMVYLRVDDYHHHVDGLQHS